MWQEVFATAVALIVTNRDSENPETIARPAE
jgi:hypothetical protein